MNKNKWIEWKIFQGCFKNKKETNKKEKKEIREETEFNNSIQDWVFTMFTSCSCKKVLGEMPRNRNIWYLCDESFWIFF